MDSENFERPFTIEIQGRFIIKPVPQKGDDWRRARVGDRNDVAIFIVENGYLRSENFILGLSNTEDMDLRPLDVFWHDSEYRAQKTHYYDHPDGIKLESSVQICCEGTRFGVARCGDEVKALLPPLREGPAYLMDPRVHWLH